jgi:rhamnose utilization protein RhaD (predicted bifunctional aldolase and dehydrogenase)
VSGAPLADLVRLSRELGAPWRRLALLAEGNTSVRDGDSLLVKASGRSLRDARETDFVRVDLAELSALVDDPAAGDAEVAAVYDRVQAEQGARPSVETLLHVVCVLDAGAGAVAHTHPESALPLLCSPRAHLLADAVLVPDQVVVLGRRGLLVPYLDPGVVLAREVRARLAAHRERWDHPRVVHLANHGIAALGPTPAATLQVTEMADKVARVLTTALLLGGPTTLPPEAVERIDSRDDEQVRRAALAAARLPDPTRTPEETP